ncbi:MAG: hypothetical protein DRP45_03935 [Candidatus Zixiibacteriota bacterium]|nr:MAG: hypothetical protein DRP45_03935 [candidate division Zixibacteria bacterium]
MLRRILPFLLLIVLISSCGRPRQDVLFPERVFLNQSLRASADVYASTTLNDSVFTIPGIKMSAQGNPKRPLVQLCLHNAGNTTVLEPFKRSHITSRDTDYHRCDICLFFGTDDGHYETQPEGLDERIAWYFESNFYEPLSPAERTCENLDVLSIGEVYHITSGNYWLLFRVTNCVWQDTLPPVWIGDCWTDTLRFRVVEDSLHE